MNKIKHYIDIKDNTYHITIDGKDELVISLDEDKDQIILSTKSQVYAGPIHLLEVEEIRDTSEIHLCRTAQEQIVSLTTMCEKLQNEIDLLSAEVDIIKGDRK